MRADEWDLIDAGDLIDYLPLTTEKEPNPKVHRFQVFKLEDGKVYAVRMLGNRDDGSASFTETETAVISCATPAAALDRWTLVRLKSRVIATGGFIVHRADTGETEYDKCPSPLDRSRKEPQTLENRR